MSHHFLSYWKPSTVETTIDLGESINHVASDQYSKIQRGDTIWIVTSKHEKLYLVGYLMVDIITDKSKAKRLLGVEDVWDAKYHAISFPDGQSIAGLRPIPDNIIKGLHFISDSRSSLKFEHNRINPQQLQRMRELEPWSADLLAELYRNTLFANPAKEKSDPWSDIELSATVDAYLWMLGQERLGIPYNKAQINKSLREKALVERSKASIEYRMQNISAVLDSLSQPHIQGYLPAKNVGEGVKNRIRAILDEKRFISESDYALTAQEDELDKKVKRLRRKGFISVPVGQAHPKRVPGNNQSFLRDPLVKAWILDNAKGRCEGCGKNGPFKSIDGELYLEVHHVRLLGKGGPDITTNAVALCPNCHRRCHHSSDRIKFVKTLYENIPRLVKV